MGYHNICAGSGETLQNFVKYGNSQHKVTKTSLLTPTVCQQPKKGKCEASGYCTGWSVRLDSTPDIEVFCILHSRETYLRKHKKIH